MNARNIVLNHDFSVGLHSWRPNGKLNAYLYPYDKDCPKNISSRLSGPFVLLTNRRVYWEGLEQEITDRVSPGTTYAVSAMVAISGDRDVRADVTATLRLENKNSPPRYLFIGKASASTEDWVNVEGTFRFTTVPHRVTFYLEGPAPEVDVLVKSVVISHLSIGTSTEQRNEKMKDVSSCSYVDCSEY